MAHHFSRPRTRILRRPTAEAFNRRLINGSNYLHSGIQTGIILIWYILSHINRVRRYQRFRLSMLCQLISEIISIPISSNFFKIIKTMFIIYTSSMPIARQIPSQEVLFLVSCDKFSFVSVQCCNVDGRS